MTCPNKNTSEYKALSKKYGDILATALYFKNNEDIPTLDQAEILLSTTEFYKQERKLQYDSKRINSEEARRLADKMSSRLGVQYQMLSYEKAAAKYPWVTKGTRGFWLGESNKVYLIDDNINSETVLHEFLHPFIENIFQKNRRLFVNLKNQALKIKEEGAWINYLVEHNYRNPENRTHISNNEWKEIITTIAGRKADRLYTTEEQKKASTTLFNRVWDYIKDLLKSLSRSLGTRYNDISNDRYANLTFDDIAELINTDDKFDLSGVTMKGAPAFQFQEKLTLGDIKSQFDKLGLELAEDEKVYKDKLGNTYERLTEFTQKTFSPKFEYFVDTPEKYMTRKYFKQQNVNPESGKVKWTDGKEYTFEELSREYKIIVNTITTQGTVTHKIIEWQITGDDRIKNEIDELITEKPGEQNLIDPSLLNVIVDSIEDIFALLQLNFKQNSREIGGDEYRDKVIPEISVSSSALGIATTIDLLTEHYDGEFSIIDWKSGSNFLKDVNDPYLLKFAEDLYNSANDSRLSRAKLEVMLRAFILKENFPNIRFKKLSIAHLNKKDIVNEYEIDVPTYLHIIENFVKDNNKDLYSTLKEKGLFNPTNYNGSSIKTFEEKDLDKLYPETKDRIKWRQEQLTRLQLSYPESTQTVEQKQEISRLTEQILELQEGGNRIYYEDEASVGLFKRWLGTLYDISNPLVQKFIRYWQRNKTKAEREINDFKHEHEVKMKKVLDEYYSKFPQKKLLNKGFIGGIDYISKNRDGSGLFDFFWIYRDYFEGAGWYRVTESDDKWLTLTEAQRDYLRFYEKTLTNNWVRTMIDQSAYVNGKEVSKAKLEQLPDLLSRDFVPRLTPTMEEVFETKGVNKKEIKRMWSKSMDNFFERSYPTSEQNIGVPVKYMGSAGIISSENHSFNAYNALQVFTTNMINKRNMDDVYAMGKGIKAILGQKADDAGDSDKFKTLENWVDHFIDINVIDREKRSSIRRKPIKIGNRYLRDDRVLDWLRNYVSTSTMWLKPVSGTFNHFLIMILNFKEAVKQSAGKGLFKINDQDLDFGIKDLAFGELKAAEVGFSSLSGKKTKLELFAEMLNYLPDNYEYSTDKAKSIVGKNKLANKSHLYFFHRIGEDHGTYAVLGAQLNHMKTKDNNGNEISMWDAYEIQDDKLVYTGGVRGYNQAGEVLEGISPEEELRMKRVSQRIHGGYRRTEKIALEANAIGRATLQFRKYLPSILNNMFQGKYNDISLGSWKKVGEREDGQPIFEWVGQINEGRIVFFGKWILTMMKLKYDPNYKWENLSAQQKLAVLDLLITGAFFAIALLGMGAALDDDDEDTYNFRKWQKLRDDLTAGYYPYDLLRGVQTGTVAVPKLITLNEGLMDYFFNGGISGEETTDGFIRGQRKIFKSLPFLSSYYEWNRFWNEKK